MSPSPVTVPARPTKAVLAALVAVAGSLGSAVTDGKVTVWEVLTALGAGVTALVSVYRVTNTPRDGGTNAKNSEPSPPG